MRYDIEKSLTEVVDLVKGWQEGGQEADLVKSFDESKHPRDKKGQFTTGSKALDKVVAKIPKGITGWSDDKQEDFFNEHFDHPKLDKPLDAWAKKNGYKNGVYRDTWQEVMHDLHNAHHYGKKPKNARKVKDRQAENDKWFKDPNA